MDAAQGKGKLVPYRQDWINIALSLAAPAVFFYPFYHGLSSRAELAVYVVLLMAWIVDLNYLLHIHVHRPFTTSQTFNRLIDAALGSVTGMTSANWRIQHVFGHHRGQDEPYTLRSLDWTLERYSVRAALSYAFGNIWITYWRPLRESYKKGVLGNETKPINFRAAFVEQVLFIAFYAALLVYRPLETLLFLTPWYIVIFAMTRYVDYLNHYGCTDEGFNFANNSLSRSFNWRINNFGYHTAHHIDPRAHWTTLPSLHARIADRIPAERLKTFNWSSALLPYHAWREHQAQLQAGRRP
ncbi:fatty acid desaturase [Caulobacter segnis]|jgi:fatty acid desaturase|uniref:fatty acid desaturase n=1 Tax=Caulobacter segnis TaxID=88688 RepID=UPI001CC11441|nr:fatty acid desaturase [Caulobacter segnis]UAL12451.1 fatty acid desaturase [Caulobacter segnis]